MVCLDVLAVLIRYREHRARASRRHARRDARCVEEDEVRIRSAPDGYEIAGRARDVARIGGVDGDLRPLSERRSRRIQERQRWSGAPGRIRAEAVAARGRGFEQHVVPPAPGRRCARSHDNTGGSEQRACIRTIAAVRGRIAGIPEIDRACVRRRIDDARRANARRRRVHGQRPYDQARRAVGSVTCYDDRLLRPVGDVDRCGEKYRSGRAVLYEIENVFS